MIDYLNYVCFCFSFFPLSVCFCLKPSSICKKKKKNHLHSTNKSVSHVRVGNTRFLCTSNCLGSLTFSGGFSEKKCAKNEGKWSDSSKTVCGRMIRQVVVIMQCKIFWSCGCRKPLVTVTGQDYNEANRLVISAEEVMCVSAACLFVFLFVCQQDYRRTTEPVLPGTWWRGANPDKGSRSRIFWSDNCKPVSVWDRVNISIG